MVCFLNRPCLLYLWIQPSSRVARQASSQKASKTLLFLHWTYQRESAGKTKLKIHPTLRIRKGRRQFSTLSLPWSSPIVLCGLRGSSSKRAKPDKISPKDLYFVFAGAYETHAPCSYQQRWQILLYIVHWENTQTQWDQFGTETQVPVCVGVYPGQIRSIINTFSKLHFRWQAVVWWQLVWDWRSATICPNNVFVREELVIAQKLLRSELGERSEGEWCFCFILSKCVVLSKFLLECCLNRNRNYLLEIHNIWFENHFCNTQFNFMKNPKIVKACQNCKKIKSIFFKGWILFQL